MGKGACVQMCFLFIYYNCVSVTVFVCYDKGNVFLYNKFTRICILETKYPCILCVALLAHLFVLCVACLTVCVNYW